MNRKIFKFDKKYASKNKCCASLIESCFVVVLVLISLCVFIFVGYLLDSITWKGYIFISLAIISWIIFIICIINKYDNYILARQSCFVKNSSNKLILLKNRVDGSSIYLGGALDNINMKTIESSKNNFFNNILLDFKFFCSFIWANKTFKQMQDEKYINELFNCTDNYANFGKYQINKVKKLEDKGRFYLVYCDITNLRTYLTIDNYKLKVFKAYSDFEELIGILEKLK